VFSGSLAFDKAKVLETGRDVRWFAGPFTGCKNIPEVGERTMPTPREFLGQ
jgi:hypothetical protein